MMPYFVLNSEGVKRFKNFIVQFQIHKFIILFLILFQFNNADAKFVSGNNSNFKNKNSFKKSNFQPPDKSLDDLYEKNEIIVKFKPSASNSRKNSIHKRINSRVTKAFRKINANVVALPGNLNIKEAIEYYKKDENVEYAEPNYKVEICTLPNDPRFNELWGLDNTGKDGATSDADIDAPEAWDTFKGDTTVVIGIIDTGIDYTHDDLKSNLWINTGEISGDSIDNDDNGYIDDFYGINAIEESSGEVMDDNGHGTHVAGTIGAVGDNGMGISGINWKAKIMALKFLSGEGSGYTSNAVECIEYVLKMKEKGVNIKVLNNSWGGSGYSQSLYDAIKLLKDAGIVFVAAAGNSAANTDENPHYPSCYDLDNIISVAATNFNDDLADFSNYGINTVDIAAPGVSILSTVPGGGYTPQVRDLFFDDMESGEGNWVHGGTANDRWRINSEQSYSGSNAWNDSPGGEYLDNTSSYIVLSKSIDLTNEKGKNLWLGFWAKIALETLYSYPIDELRIEISKDGGSNWKIVKTLSGESDWTLYNYYIPESHKTSQFKIRFFLETDYSITFDGVYIDDVGIGLATGSKNYELYSGTSMAAPHVTGSIALLCGNKPDENYKTIIDLLQTSVDPIEKIKNKILHQGRINLNNAINKDVNSIPTVITNISMTKGPKRLPLIIKGRRFGSNPGKVFFYPHISASTSIWNDSTIYCAVPDGAETGDITISSEDGRSSSVYFKVGAYLNSKISIPNSVRDASMVSLNDKVYVIGGTYWGDGGVVQIYDHIYNYWKMGTSKPTPCSRAYACVLNNKIYVPGGYSFDDFKPVDVMEIYDPAIDKWSGARRLPFPLYGHTTVSLNNKIYVIGGINEKYNLNPNVYEYNPESNEWTKRASMIHPRSFHAVGVIDGKIYIYGGKTFKPYINFSLFSDPLILSSTEVYDPVTDIFTELAEMIDLRYDLAGISINGKLYAIGGSSSQSGQYLQTIEEYDPILNKWKYYDYFLTKARNGLRAAVINNYMYIIGGTYSRWLGDEIDINECLDLENRPILIKNPVYITDLKSDISIGLVPLDILFNVTAAGGSEAYKYYWDFGDGSQIKEIQNTAYSYVNAGKYNAKVVVKDAYDTTNFTVGNLQINILDITKTLNVDLSVSAVSGTAPLKVSFLLEISGEQPPYDLSWDFGDKKTEIQTAFDKAITMEHIYTSSGKYTVSITATKIGANGSQRHTIVNKTKILVNSKEKAADNGGGGGSKTCVLSKMFTNEQMLSNLNKFKDEYLLNNFFGKAFVDFYYKIQE